MERPPPDDQQFTGQDVEIPLHFHWLAILTKVPIMKLSKHHLNLSIQHCQSQHTDRQHLFLLYSQNLLKWLTLAELTASRLINFTAVPSWS